VKVLVYVIAGALGLVGLLFIVAGLSHGNAIVRIPIGLICMSAGVALVVLVRLRPQHHVHEMKVELPGDTSLEQVQCNQCGATLSSKSVRVAAGAVFISCEFCGAEYQLEEAPKW
jgi:hypothetical protein